MGVDLKIIPVDCDFVKEGKGLYFGHSLLTCEREYSFFEEINSLEKHEIKAPFGCFVANGPNGGCGYGDREKDPYGEMLKTVSVSDFLECKAMCVKNMAIKEYVKLLPVNTELVLFWC